MKWDEITKRVFTIGAVVCILIILCVIKLFDLQILNGETYRVQADNRSVRTYIAKAPRGEIYDRNGVPIVENRAGYSIQIYKTDIDNDELNNNIIDLVRLLRENEDEYSTTFPIVYNSDEKVPEYDLNILLNSDKGGDNKTKKNKQDKNDDEDKNNDKEKNNDEEQDNAEEESIIKGEKIAEWEAENNLSEYKTLREIVRYFIDKYDVSGELSESEKLDVIAVRYEMEKRKFGQSNPFIMATDVDVIVVQKVKEKYTPTGFADIVSDTIRTYAKGSMAAHILGRTGIIYAEEYETLKNQGYGMNDIIGKDGLEAVLESYLKGTDGYSKVRLNSNGRYGDVVESVSAKPGNYAELTIDAELQKATEDALKKYITASVGTNGAGAAIAVDPHNGQVLAIASYPAYDPETFSEDYETLLNKKSNPLFNRALNGTYAPGSTFKILTSVAGLETGLIDPDTYITDRGRYTYYTDYQPTCLVYSSSGTTHGSINVSEAIGVSCNYFFYDIGRRMGIEAIDEYCEKFGLGKSTGIELNESKGVVASPEEREAAGGEWHPGDVLQAAIGQSDNLFTPAQIASYICTVLNKGTRYKLHLINKIVDYETKEAVKEFGSEILSENPISDSTFAAVKEGMRQVVADGTAASVFGSSKLKVGGKTGTAQVSDGADNVLFTGFAPYDDPEIVVAVVIEHGANSAYAAQIGKEIFEAYLYGDEEDEDKKSQSDRYEDDDYDDSE